MVKVKVLCLALFFVASGCGQHYIMPDSAGVPQKISVSAYTNSGCIETLHEEAAKNDVKVKLTDVKSDLGWGIVLWPIYKSYTCTGEVVK